MRFPGNKGATNCYLSQVCRKSRRSQPQLPVAPQLPLLPSPITIITMYPVGAQVSHEPPLPLLGGFVLGDVYYTGESKTFESGDRVEHGKQGEVVLGPATGESHKGNGVRVLFPGNKGATDCYLDQVCRSQP